MKRLWPIGLRCEVGATAIVILLVTSFLVDAAERSTPQLEFDHASGFYESEFPLALSKVIPGAVVYYTTNAALPHPSTGIPYRKSIPIRTTTIVRAAAFKGNTAVTDVETRTYLFPAATQQQSGSQLPGSWGTNSGSAIPAHYVMSETAASEEITAGLQALPIISIVTETENLFSPATGIYLHPMERGNNWERSASMEMFGGRNPGGFRVNCGLRIHGGMSRRPEESPKHSFRLVFKRRYGLAKLTFPVFEAGQRSEYDELILRAGGSDSWLDSNGERRQRALYLRDEWMRQSMAAMGYPSARGQLVHLYLNGLYWGVYDLCERPGTPLTNQATSKDDVQNADKTESGDRIVWDKVMTLANSGLGDPANYQTISRYLDLAQLADYLILNFYAGNSDWDRSANWYAIRPRTAEGKFRFFVWDAEQTFGEVDANTLDLDDDKSPMRLFQKLTENSAFRALFAARAQHLLFQNGPLSPAAAAERFRQLSESLRAALPVEAARWGNYRASVHQYKNGPYEPLSVPDHWQPEINRLLSDYIPRRREILLEQFRERGLFSVGDTSGEP
ncbi:MAG TPA: CotH kinase family protein [Verrucomicrobiae bacterium]|nr:CotH kinase family protein [Verrucomicrobiae bacterium]